MFLYRSDDTLTDEESAECYKKMKVTELKDLLRQSGLTVSGKKADLIKRLQYSARAKKALISPSCGDDIKKPNSATKNENTSNVEISTRKSLRKRPISRPESTTNGSTVKRLKVCQQETISSSLRKRSPVASSASKPASTMRRISPIASTTKTRKTPPSRIETRSLKRISPVSSIASTRSTRSATRRTTSKNEDASYKENKSSSVPQRMTSKKKSDPLSTITNSSSTITNSAKKRKFERRASMKKSVNKALLQLEQQLEAL